MRERAEGAGRRLSGVAVRAGESLRPLVPPGSVADRTLAPVARRLRARARSGEGRDPRSRVISEFARCFPKAFFIQVGSNDGLKLDPLRPHILSRRWSGIMIEPLPYVFEQLAAEYGQHPRIILENVAVADHDGTAELFYIPESADPSLPNWYDALGTFRKDVLLKHTEFIPDIASRISSVAVPCLTFESLCAKHSVETIDLVQMDTEGYDFEVIKLIDLERHRPKLLMFEHLHLKPADYEACLRLLRNHGYEDISDTMDTVCLRVSDLGPEHRRLLQLWRDLSAGLRRPDAAGEANGATVTRARRLARRVVAGALRRVGYSLVRLPNPDFNVATDGQLDGFDPGLHSSPSSLPPAAAKELREDNPRLLELRKGYSDLDWPVCSHSRWRPGHVSGFLSLPYFRGDTVYLWHYRNTDELAQLKYFVYLRYLTERDTPGLLEKLDEDGAFGCWTYEFPGYKTCSRDLLDSVNELLFLDRHLSILRSDQLRILDIGAGYGRLAHRASEAIGSLSVYCCVDAVPESTFLSEFYTSYREVSPPVRVVPLTDVPELGPGDFDLAFNVHSFSECPLAAIEWWMQLLAKLRVPRLFLVPNEPAGFLSTEEDGTRKDYLPLIEAAGYRCVVEEWAFDDPGVRTAIAISDRFCLFELEA